MPAPAAQIAEQQFSAVTKDAYAPLARLLSSQRYRGAITDLMINGPGDGFVDIAGRGMVRIPASDLEWATPAHLRNLCSFMAANLNIRFSEELPILACRTPDNHRFQAWIGGDVESGISIAIRVKRMTHATWDDFHVPPEQQELIEQTIVDGGAILLSGGTGSGKTTFQNMIAQLIPSDRRIITIEDTREIELPKHPNKVHLTVARSESLSLVTWADAIDHCVRARPDVILPGELSIRNALPILQAMDTGHESVITTLHANSPLDALRGFRRRIAISGGAASETNDLFDYLGDTISLVIQIKRVRRPGQPDRRMVTDVIPARELVAKSKAAGPGDDRLLSPEDQTTLRARELGLEEKDDGR